MPKGPQGQKRPADVLGNAVHVMRIPAMQMKYLAMSLVLATTLVAAATIHATDAASHIGQNITVEGVVSNVHEARGSGTIFLDMGGSYPNNAFTAVTFPDDASKFPNVTVLSGKTVDITGTIQDYKGKPEIILKSADQVKAAQ